MDLKPQYTRITNYKKLVDRFITSQAKTQENPKKQDMGTIFALIEILNPWHPNAQIGQTIINTLTREYYRQSNSNELINFENALKKVNEKLVEITQRGETDWIGKINASLILIAKNKIHLAYTGKTKAYLWRSQKILPIINPKETYTYNHPLKTFSSVVSGDLRLKDKIFFSTNLLFDHIDAKKLEQILSEKSLVDIGSQIANILKSRNTRQANCILIEMGVVNQEETQTPEAIYLDQEQFSVFTESLKKSFGNLKDSTKDFSSWFNKSIKTSKQYYNEKILPKSKEIITKTTGHSHKKSSTENSHAQTPIIKKTSDNKLSPNINYYDASSKKIVLYLKKTSDFISKITRKLIVFLKNSLKPKNRSKTFIIIAIVLLVIFITNIGYLKKINSNKENIIQTQETIKTLGNKFDDASLALMTDDKDKAIEILSEISSELNSLQYDSSLEEQVQSLKDKLNEKLDEISNTKRLSSPTETIEKNNIGLFTLTTNNIVAIDANTDQISLRAIDDTNSQLDNIATLPTTDGIAQTVSSEDEDTYILTDKQELYLLNNNELNKKTNNDSKWNNAIALENYLNNIYFLDSDAGQIYKYTLEGENFSDAQDYVDTSVVDIKQSVDFAIDGYIYVLESNGTIEKIMLGKSENISPTMIPEPHASMSQPKKIYTKEGLNSLYVLDTNRIVELDKNGNYVTQFAFSDDITDIKDFAIIPEKSELYILNNNKIYKYNY